MKQLSWKWVISFAVVLAALIYVLPTFKPGLWPHKKINLGLDLQGGMHLVLEVDTEKAVQGRIENILDWAIARWNPGRIQPQRSRVVPSCMRPV